MPYIFSNAVKTSKTGIPSIRAMVMEFSEIGAEDCDRQYMLGDSLLIAPVMSECGNVDVYLPQGLWTNFFNGNTVLGNGWRRETHDYFSLPLYVRENTIVPVGHNENETEYDYAEGVTINLYEISEKGSEFEIYNTKGELALKVNAIKKDNKLYVDFDNISKSAWIKLHFHDSGLNGKLIEIKEAQTIIEL
jgi:alpha-D-xyloside xylohydrolase